MSLTDTSRALGALLQQWDAALLAVAAHERCALPWPVDRTGTALRPGADPGAVLTLERRLGTTLPASYRSFLLLTDGAWAQPGWGYRGLPPGVAPDLVPPTGPGPRCLGMLDTTQVGWFRDRDPVHLESWAEGHPPHRPGRHGAFTADLPEAQYLQHASGGVAHKVGHLPYTLQVGGTIDGHTVLLNPLVATPDGEWEAWEFGSTTLGGRRFRSFAALLEHDLATLRRREEAPPSGPDVDDLESLARDEHAGTFARARAVFTLVNLGQRHRVRDLLLRLAADRDGDPDVVRRRHLALSILSSDDADDVTGLLLEAAEDSDRQVRATALRGLARRDHAAARDAAVDLLTRSEEPDSVVGAVTAPGTPALVDAWERSGHRRLLVQLARTGDERAVPALVEAAHGSLPDGERVTIGWALLRLGAVDAGVEVLARYLAQERVDRAFAAHAVLNLSALDHDGARAALLDHARRRPSPGALRALGWHGADPACTLLVDYLDDPGLRLAALDALERLRCPGALDALAASSASGDLLATRALARRRDPRALDPLLTVLAAGDLDDARQAADGLRDLREPVAAQSLLHAVVTRNDAELRAIATHALVMLGPTARAEAAAALAQIAADDDPDLRRLAELWGDAT